MKSKLFVMCLYETFMYDIVQLIKCNLLQLWMFYIYILSAISTSSDKKLGTIQEHENQLWNRFPKPIGTIHTRNDKIWDLLTDEWYISRC